MPKNKKKNTKKEMPFVSICTPTFNRRPFIPTMIKLIENQTYPKDRLEWIIVDDGTDPIGDLIKDIPYAKYFHYEGEKMKLGKKRNISPTWIIFKGILSIIKSDFLFFKYFSLSEK